MATLDSVEIEGYKSIRSAKIELGPINVLIGANGAGKSNLLGVFGLLADLADGRLQLHIGRQGGANALLHFGRKRTQELRLKLEFGQYGYLASLVPSINDSLVFSMDHAIARASTKPSVQVTVDSFEATPDSVCGLSEDAARAVRARGDRHRTHPSDVPSLRPVAANPRGDCESVRGVCRRRAGSGEDDGSGRVPQRGEARSG